MALIQPDFSEVAEEIKPGTYRGIIKKGEVKEYQSGLQYVNWEIETYGETEPRNNGRRIFHKTPVSGKGAFQLQKFFRAATGEALTGEFDTERLVGKQVELTIVNGVRDGVETGYTEVKNVKQVTAQ